MNTKLTAQEVIAALTNFSLEELSLINRTLVNLHKEKQRSPGNARAQASAMAKAQFKRFDDVEFTSTRLGGVVIKGQIIKICSKNVHVQTAEQKAAHAAGAREEWFVVPPMMLRKQAK